MANEEAAKLDQFIQWLQACNSDKGFGIYTSADAPEDGVLLVVPLDLAITPMRVLQDPVVGLECRKLFEDGDGDDRFLMILFLTVERLLTNSSWKPYLDMLPTSFGNPLWFTDDEIEELKGTALYRASKLQKKKLQDIFDSKVKNLVKTLLLLQGNTDRHLLAGGFFPVETSQNDCNSKAAKVSNYSWSGKRRMPSYLSKLVFPEDFLTALRTISMKEDQLYQVSSMIEEALASHSFDDWQTGLMVYLSLCKSGTYWSIQERDAGFKGVEVESTEQLRTWINYVMERWHASTTDHGLTVGSHDLWQFLTVTAKAYKKSKTTIQACAHPHTFESFPSENIQQAVRGDIRVIKLFLIGAGK
ncbi:unnamed protein product [Rhodiola kirilowii]